MAKQRSRIRGWRWKLFSLMAFTGMTVAACADGDVVAPEIDDGMGVLQLASAQAGAEANAASTGTFEFLQPLVESSDPAGDFDPDLSPVVEICEIESGECADWPLVTFTRETDDLTRQIQVNTEDGYYWIDWNTGDVVLDPALFYRIRVVQGGIELGHVDIDPVATSEELAGVDTSLYFGFVIGETIPIRFHITAEAQETVPAADLSLTKTASADTIEVGAEVEFTMVVTNAGPDTAYAVVLTDDLPGELTFVSSSATAGSCAEAEGDVTCALGDLAPDSAVTVTILAAAAGPGEAENEAEVEADTQDPNNDDNEAEAVVIVRAPTADLSVTKTASADSVDVGAQFDYTITVANAGPDAALGVIVTDELDDAVSYVGATASQGSCVESDGDITCELGELVAGASATVTITVQADEPGDVENEAEVTSTTADPNEADNDAEARVVIRANEIDDDDDEAAVFDGFFFLPPLGSDVPELGPNNQSLEPVVQICEVAGETCLLPALAEFDRDDLTSISAAHFHINWKMRDSDADPDADYMIRVLVDGAVLGAMEVPDGNPNRSIPIKFWIGDTFESTPLPVADLSLTKTASADTVEVGAEVTYTLTVANAGPDAVEAVLGDAIPDGLEVLDVTPSQGECALEDGTVQCDLGELAAGATAEVVILALADEAGELENEAWVAGTALDPNTEDNSAAALVVVTGGDEDGDEDDPAPTTGADLALTGGLSETDLVVGAAADYTLIVENLGPDAASGTVLAAGFSNHFDVVSVSGDGDCRIQGRKVKCDLGKMLAGESRTVIIAIEVDRSGSAEIEAEVESEADDPDGDNNETEVELVIG